MSDKVSEITSQLTAARRHLEQLGGQRDNYIRAAENRHWTELDSATGSGIRRKPDRKKDTARFARYSREAQVFADHEAATEKVKLLESRLADAITARDRVRFTREDVAGARAIRTDLGWHKVARINKTTVSVETGYSWVDRIAFEKILEIHK